MNISTLDSERLYNSFLSGAHEVIKNKNSLNEINVFPVADGDTGSNLSSTFPQPCMRSSWTQKSRDPSRKR